MTLPNFMLIWQKHNGVDQEERDIKAVKYQVQSPYYDPTIMEKVFLILFGISIGSVVMKIMEK